MPVGERDLAIDKALTELCGLTPFLSLVTPVNVPEARAAFLAGDEPEFEYRPLPDLDDLQARLDAIRPEEASDPAIASMATSLVRHLNDRLEMLRHRDSERFFLISVEMFGHVDEGTYELASRLLEEKPAKGGERSTVSAEEFAEAARRELDSYRDAYPEMAAEVLISSSVPGVMVESGNLQVGSDVRIGRDRVDPLIQHEVGTHIVTFENGRSQPLHMLSHGLAGYDELQEALGVLAEHLAGGIPPSRLRVLAYRVMAAHLRAEGAEFRETFDRLLEWGCSRRVAFSTVMRAYRSGGMTKDAIYLRGLVKLLDYLARGASLEPLFVGKISFEAVPLIFDLMERRVLNEPPLKPRFLERSSARQRLTEIQRGVGVEEIGGLAA